MVKKIIALFMCVCFFPTPASAVSTGADGAVVIEAATRQIIYSNNCHERFAMASTTKIMTAALAIENGNTTDLVTVSQNAQNQEGSSIYLRTNDRITLEDLLYGLMLNSGNDAAVAIAEYIGGSTENFVKMMNEKAEELGCRDTHFTNPSGLYDKNHYSSAYDMAIIMSYAMENDEFKKIISTKEYQINTGNSVTYLRNHNKLLWQYEKCIGGKTGFTKLAGRCLVTCAERDDITLIAVTLNDSDDWRDHKNLYEYSFERTTKKNIIKRNDILCTRKIRGQRINILAGENFTIPYVSGKKSKISCKIYLSEKINGEIRVGMNIGSARIYSGKYYIGTIPVTSGQSGDNKQTFSRSIDYILRHALLNR